MRGGKRHPYRTLTITILPFCVSQISFKLYPTIDARDGTTLLPYTRIHTCGYTVLLLVGLAPTDDGISAGAVYSSLYPTGVKKIEEAPCHPNEETLKGMIPIFRCFRSWI